MQRRAHAVIRIVCYYRVENSSVAFFCEKVNHYEKREKKITMRIEHRVSHIHSGSVLRVQRTITNTACKQLSIFKLTKLAM